MEGDAGQVQIIFTVSLSSVSGESVQVNYATANGTATAGSDYVATTGTVTFAPGVTEQSVIVSVLGDVAVENIESFLVKLSNPVNVQLGDDTASGVIIDNELANSNPAVWNVQFSVPEFTVIESDGFATISVVRPVSSVSAAVVFTASNGTALDGSDYKKVRLLVLFAPGETEQTLQVQILDDTIVEPSEIVKLDLRTPTGQPLAGNLATSELKILDDDAKPAISISDEKATEGDGGTSEMVFTVHLSAVSYHDVTVNYTTANGTATADPDYIASSGVLTIPAGSLSKVLIVLIQGELLYEKDENFFVNLSLPVNATVADSQGIGTILNDDQKPSVSIGSVALTEGNSGTKDFVFTVTLSAPSGTPGSVSLAVNNGTATVANNDYQDGSGVLTFSPGGPLSLTVTVKVVGDTTFEADETFTVALSGAVEVTIADSGTGTILNDDFAVVTGQILEDLDGDGAMSLSEIGLEGVKVRAIDSLGVTRTATTNLNGFYTFNLAAGPAILDVNNGTVRRAACSPRTTIRK